MGILVAFGLIKILNHDDDLLEDLRFAPLDMIHKLPQLLLLRPVDHKSIAILQKQIELFGEIRMLQQRMTQFKIAVVFVISLLVLPQEFNNVFVGLQVLSFQPLEPPLGMLHIKLFKSHTKYY